MTVKEKQRIQGKIETKKVGREKGEIGRNHELGL